MTEVELVMTSVPNLQTLQHIKRGSSISCYLVAETSPPTPVASVKLITAGEGGCLGNG